MPWKNGGGTTQEIAIDRTSDPPAWRLSLARIDRDGPFSDFSGYDRTMVPISGLPFELDFDDGDVLRVQRAERPVRFAGERRTSCHLLAGPAVDLNVMTRRDCCTHRVFVLARHSRRLPLVPGDLHFVYVLEGADAGDTWQVRGEDGIDIAAPRICLVTIHQVEQPDT